MTARAQAGNLAHALKTPLAVIANDAAEGADPALAFRGAVQDLQEMAGN